MKWRVVEFLPTFAAEITFKKPKFVIDADGVEEEFTDIDRENFGEFAGPYLKPHQPNVRFLDKQYGIRRQRYCMFMIGNSILTVDDTSYSTINGRHFKGTRGLWELLNC